MVRRSCLLSAVLSVREVYLCRRRSSSCPSMTVVFSCGLSVNMNVVGGVGNILSSLIRRQPIEHQKENGVRNP